jgi:hypothetical protein
MSKITLSAEERQEVRCALRYHSEILTQVESLSSISKLSKLQLLAALDALHINLEDAKSGNYVRKIEESARKHGDPSVFAFKPAFSGALMFDIDLHVMGQILRRQIIIDYQYVPPWPFVDAQSGEELIRVEQGSKSFHMTDYDRKSIVCNSSPRRTEQRAKYPRTYNITESFPDIVGIFYFDDAIEEDALRQNRKRKQLFRLKHLNDGSRFGGMNGEDLQHMLLEPMLDQVITAFKVKFGRDPQPGDPIFFDPDFDIPTSFDPQKLSNIILKAMVKVGAPPEIIYAFEKTGFLSPDCDGLNLSENDRALFLAAIHEYRALNLH